jgi:rod shape-determining protein MreC
MGASIVGATVAHEPGHLTRAIKLDVGRADGVVPRMTVASPRGLVGQVVRATEHWSDVLLITDPSSAVAGRIDRSREAGMVFGSPSGELVMRYIPQDRPDAPPNVQVGDLVYTSGQSERFAPRLLVGQVILVRQNDFETFQEAVIRPSVDLNAIETVLIVTAWLPREDEAAADPP